MKKIFSVIMLLLCLFTAQAQTDVTKFLGIPVDGFKSDMRKKLIAKGFSPVQGQEYLQGQFNGADVNLYIVTNNNKVCRIMVADANTKDEGDIRIRFNVLVHQFENNKKYVSLDKYAISEDEDISYEMSVHNKKYEAVFYQNVDTTKIDVNDLQQKVWDMAMAKYTQEQLQNPTEDIQKDMIGMSAGIFFDLLSKKSVWFRIVRNGYSNEYYISMYYDNEYNRANGDDL